jgi:hypothetical protein
MSVSRRRSNGLASDLSRTIRSALDGRGSVGSGFDDVEAWADRDGWSRVVSRDAAANVDSRAAVGEFEALLIQILGTRAQNQMRFREGERWEQVVSTDYAPRQIMSRVDGRPIKSRTLSAFLDV